MALIIGLTGGIASGKSTVSRMLLDINIPVIDADLEARKVVEKGEKAYVRIIETFGSEILTATGDIDRVKLGSIVFHDEDKRNQLNAIVHPAVRERMNDKKVKYVDSGNSVVILDIPLLFESKLTHMVDKTILVYVDAEVQLNRLMSRNQLIESEAMARIKSQMPLKEKIKLADAVIDNNGTIHDTKTQLIQILNNWGVLEKA
ncbi:dephospho-CoA kinase [Pseudoneobacillus rhizosphaerae]|uniref:Dephospho-CoA kinase n=1 Tax=Pseudoneobacillus rhizosphaerae TaxID=2880968 RepID=A0A9C7GAQ6_9BACI|nr:dephospho-CoA kinase [Pseudoneobacillus rhizosphaerae]CAG9608863.1 Dephospho-CoA kinase [Pseudoneobacillus rhizosphaerae]